MPYSVPTLRQLIASGALDLEASLDTVLPKFGIELALNAAVSAAIRDAYDHQAWIVRQIIPTTESDDRPSSIRPNLKGSSASKPPMQRAPPPSTARCLRRSVPCCNTRMAASMP